MFKKASGLWEEAGGKAVKRKDGRGGERTVLEGHDEVKARLTEGYALKEAAKLDLPGLYKGEFSSATDRILDMAKSGSPETDKEIRGIDVEIAALVPEAERDDEIGRLSLELKKFRYSPGSWGFGLNVEKARELIRLETERQGGDRKKSLEMYPEAAEVLLQAGRHVGRDRGQGR
jgi:hypothetical protein